MDPNESEDWQLSLDVDDSDLFLTSTKHTINKQEARVENTRTQKNVSNKSFVVEKNDSQPVRIIPGPAGIVQSAKLLKTQLIRDGVEDFQTPTQAFIIKSDEELDQNECFTHGPWVGAVDYVHNNEGIVYGCLGNIDKFMKKGKLEQVIAIVMSVSSNAIGDLTVTLKDPTGSVSGAVHHKVLNEEGGYGRKHFTEGTTLVLANVSVFTPKESLHYLNITKRNIVKVSNKDTVPDSGSCTQQTQGCSGVADFLTMQHKLDETYHESQLHRRND